MNCLHGIIPENRHHRRQQRHSSKALRSLTQLHNARRPEPMKHASHDNRHSQMETYFDGNFFVVIHTIITEVPFLRTRPTHSAWHMSYKIVLFYLLLSKSNRMISLFSDVYLLRVYIC